MDKSVMAGLRVLFYRLVKAQVYYRRGRTAVVDRDPQIGQIVPSGEIIEDCVPDVAVTLRRGPHLNVATAVKINIFYQHLKVARGNDSGKDSRAKGLSLPIALIFKLQTFHDFYQFRKR
jgi:hypothetical protein